MLRLKELRLSKNLTQKDLADLLGCNQTAVGKYERSQLEPNIDTLLHLSTIFEVTVDYLLGHSDDFGNVNVSLQPNGAELSKDEKTLLEYFSQLGPFERDSILVQVQALAQKHETLKR